MKIEVGKKYMRRDGSGPVEIVSKNINSFYKFRDSNGETYSFDGLFYRDATCYIDLVSEYIEPEEKPVKYKEGDLVTFEINNFQAQTLNNKEYPVVNLYKEYIVEHKPAPEPKKGTFWVNVYEDEVKYHPTREAADKNASKLRRLACVEVNWTEGDGL